MKLLRDAPIRRKLEAIILVTSAVVLSLSLISALALNLASLRGETQMRLQGLAEVLGANSRAALAFGDEPAAAEILATLSTQREVVLAEIRLPDDGVFAGYRSPRVGGADGGEGLFPAQVSVEQPITLDGEELGTIRLVGDMRRGYAKLLQQAYLALAVFAVSMLLAFLISRRLQRVVSAPVERLLRTMDAVAETKDFSWRAERLGNDELGALVDGFNFMLARLEENRSELEAYRRQLENVVQARTRELRESEARLKLFVEHAPAALAMFDRDMRYLAASNRWLDDYGLEWPDIAGRCHYDVFPDMPSRWLAIHRRALAGEVIRADEDPFVRADGTVQWLRWEVRPWYADGDVVGGIVVFSEDITESRQVKDALVRRTWELERMNTELEEFAYVASHDLKAPLRAVANLAQVVEEDAGKRLDEENRRLLRLMRERVVSMDELIDGLLRYARIGRTERNPTAVELPSLLQDVVDSLSLPEGFAVEWAPDLPVLTADAVELRQIFQNLIANAASHHDRPQEGHVWIRSCSREQYECIEVADDGPGIPEHMRTEIFRMFSTGGTPGHTGIGLAVVRKMVLANGGRIEVDANVPRGAVFRIELPESR